MLCTLALMGTACGDDVDQPTDQDYEDIAQSVAPLLQAEVTGEGGAMVSAQLATGNAPFWLSVEANGSAEGRAGSLQWSLNATCSDASNAPLDVCDETTDTATVASSFAGALMLPHYNASVSASQDWSVSGLQGGVLVAEGQTRVDASTTFTGIFRPVTRSFDLDLDADYSLAIPWDAPEQVTGSMSATVDAHRNVMGSNNDSDAHFIVDARATLDGSGAAIITLDGNVSFELNLASGALVRVDASTAP